ncbi:uncharacterized protein SPPG_02444 [Spizellomyces punctatus DAOM BR117]|uniref:Extracellular membrane protein CFEM domain-containing protein n=1 Tax=Spizellomyces punctatus (strain DAOM BR117) TaxID=645134 RepID=A0A0L0HKE3_SPIPD|nr:uncharacterized protein SPPG_02444 [Spizellomyces punctatus DAOM BR117]KND01936.1 hypothetical protein SPPG_02444 [Spizellomyces punctatus DAOM BR117]|eukprot:XP_016609975.1 hypothetical protein SPPG_02444 [Spizellomyces punctatus DAOM BR117]
MHSLAILTLSLVSVVVAQNEGGPVSLPRPIPSLTLPSVPSGFPTTFPSAFPSAFPTIAPSSLPQTAGPSSVTASIAPSGAPTPRATSSPTNPIGNSPSNLPGGDCMQLVSGLVDCESEFVRAAITQSIDYPSEAFDTAIAKFSSCTCDMFGKLNSLQSCKSNMNDQELKDVKGVCAEQPLSVNKVFLAIGKATGQTATIKLPNGKTVTPPFKNAKGEVVNSAQNTGASLMGVIGLALAVVAAM